MDGRWHSYNRFESLDQEGALTWQWVDLFEEGGRQKLIRALRVCADQIGASLRWRGHYGKPAPQEEEKDIMIARNPAEPIPSDFPISDMPNPREVVGSIDFPERKETGSVIWVDENWNVYRDSKKLGTLNNEHKYKLPTHLVAHKGEMCDYSSIQHALFGKKSLEFGDLSGVVATAYRAVNSIRRLIEEDFEHPKLLIEIFGQGYKLDW